MSAHPQSCATCDQDSCAMKRAVPASVPAGATAFLLDAYWPEYASYVAAMRQEGDQLLAPGIAGRATPARYGWPGATHRAGGATLARHAAMRRVARARGGVRQAAYLAHDRKVAEALARHLDWRATHLVVAQSLLPWLHRMKLLGGRSYDVLMIRHSLAEIHARLDSVHAAMPDSPTIADFRAERQLVDDEAAALAGARHIVTPHQEVAALAGVRARLLAWHLPPAQPVARGGRVAFLGPGIARARPDIVRAVAATLDQPLIRFGSDHERGGWWDGIAVEHRAMGPRWLDGIGAIVHPAAMTHEPRALLQAVANGVTLYATPGCGLPREMWRPVEDLLGSRAAA